MSDRSGRVITFYSYKGGVGRTMALAHVAVKLAQWGHRVLAIDGDLEAPGLDAYFARQSSNGPTAGLLELVNGELGHWRQAVRRVETPIGAFDLVTAGRADDRYAARLHALDWKRLYAEGGLGQEAERWRAEWTRSYDFVLVDSRTGMSDAGGLTTIQLPDVLVVLFTANTQSVDGVARVAAAARAAQAALPIGRARMMVVPVPTRVEQSEYQLWNHTWLPRIVRTMAPFVEEWADPEGAPPEILLKQLAVPHVGYWSFGENVPALEGEARDKLQVGYALDMLAALLARGLSDTAELAREPDSYVRRASAGPERIGAGGHIFLSASRDDQDLEQALARAFEARGLRVWSTASIEPGQRLTGAIETAIRGAVAHVVVVGRSFSAWQQEELSILFRESLARTGVPTLFSVVRGQHLDRLPGILRSLPVSLSPEEAPFTDFASIFAHEVAGRLALRATRAT